MDRDVPGNRETSSPDNETLMCAVLEALGNGRPQPLLDAVHEDVAWKLAVTQKGFFPFGGEYHGRAGVAQSLADFARRYAFRRFEPRELLSKGEIVWGLFDVLIEQIEEGPASRSTIATQIAIRWRVRGNKILEHQAFADTLPLFFAPLPAASQRAVDRV